MKHFIFFIVIFLSTSCKSKKVIYTGALKKSDSLIRRSNHFLKVNNLDSAKYYISEALLLDSANCGAYNNRAILKFKEGKPATQVLSDFETSLRICPGYETALFSLANYYYEIKDYKQVVKACTRYDFQSNKIDSIHIKEIDRLNSRALHYEKLIGTIFISRAVSFYDSVNSILKNADSLQERFNTKLSTIGKNIKNNKDMVGEFDYLNRQFDSLIVSKTRI